jgi:membrane associated rhomboid family serine protease
MRYETRYRGSGSLSFPSFPNGVKWLIVANVAIFLIEFFGSLPGGVPIFRGLRLVPSEVIHGQIWELVTYLFLHSLTTFTHILFNMLMLWMFGAPVEETWGTKRFLQYYFLCGVGAGICHVVVNLLLGNPHQPVLGASGAIFGLLLAFGMLFPEQVILLFFLFPIKAKYMVMIFGAIEFLSAFQPNSGVSNLAHLGGMLFGYFYIKNQFGAKRARLYGAKSPGFSFNLAGRWKEYKLQRARSKFKVYMKKHGSDRDPWVN